MMNSPGRPVFRYLGGKWLLAPEIIAHFPVHKTYVEPFGGAASVLMRKPRSYAEIYNDLNGEVVHVFRILRDPVQAGELERLIRLTPYSREEFEKAYEQSDDPLEKARRTLLKSWFGYGPDGMFRKSYAGFRVGHLRAGSTPIHDWVNFSDHLTLFTKRLRGVGIENLPAIKIISRYDGEETLIYADPPYLQSTRKDPRHKYSHEMSEEDHVQLARVLHDVKSMVIISGYPSELYQDLYSDWRKVLLKGIDQVRTKDITEVLWCSPNTPQVHPELFV